MKNESEDTAGPVPQEWKERIEKDGRDYANTTCFNRGNEYSNHQPLWEGYVAGATAEHQRKEAETWNKAIDSVKDVLFVLMEDEENEGLAALDNAYKKLESLKK